ncbi:lipopolysaccharide biosynthesis protein [Thermophilibacter provencensis]|uniref:Polysaccharide biosynthesis protein n=1 Tax=Thermophilibacter provencensis TaxID=1852386 RepID=A0ABT7V1L9_9ACTN|nr:hypothetical protein [Thermophilibacter provencensis]MDM8270473.1 hypothetical protein [Thermophilibacter provencensis]
MKEPSLKANMLWNSVGSLMYSSCQWLLTVLVVRLSTSYDAAGTLALAMALSNVFVPIALYRIRSYQVSDIHEETSSGEYVGLRFVTIAAGLAITGLYALASCDAAALPAVMLYLLYRAGEVFIDVLHGVDQQHLRMDYCGVSLFARGLLSVAPFSAVLALTNSLELAVLSMVVATYPVILWDARKASRFSSIRPIFSRASIARLLVACLPAVIGNAACNFTVTFARQYLSLSAGEEALGIYASVCTPIVLIQACASYVYAPLLGVFAERLDRGDAAGFRALLAKVVVALGAVFALGALAFALVGDWFIGLVFGAGMVPYAYLMYAGILCSALTACMAFLGDLLVTMRAMRTNLVGNVVACLLSLPLSVVLVDACGMNGVSLSVSAAFAVGIALMGWGVLARCGRGAGEA